MFPEGAKEPYDRTRKIVSKLAEQIRKMPYRVMVTGHTAASKHATKAGLWRVRPFGRPRERRAPNSARGGREVRPALWVAGSADTEPLFPEDPVLPANRRVSITLMKEAPPAPFGIKP